MPSMASFAFQLDFNWRETFTMNISPELHPLIRPEKKGHIQLLLMQKTPLCHKLDRIGFNELPFMRQYQSSTEATQRR